MLIGLSCKFTTFSRIYQLLCSSHWLLMKMIQYISFIPSWVVHIKGGLEAEFTQNSPLLCSFCADAFLVLCCYFLSAGLAVCRVPHVSCSHCVIPFPSGALPSEHTAAGFTSCSPYCLLLPFFQSQLGDPHFFQEPLQLCHVGVFNQNVVLYKNNLCVHKYI